MHSLVIDVGRYCGNITFCVSVRLLFVRDEMLGNLLENTVKWETDEDRRYLRARDDTCRLDALNSLICQCSAKVRIIRETYQRSTPVIVRLATSLIPSQFRPLEAIRPNGPTTGPRAILTPLVRNSPPTAFISKGPRVSGLANQSRSYILPTALL